MPFVFLKEVAYDIAKIYIWKQITTPFNSLTIDFELLMILQRYTFGSKSQLLKLSFNSVIVAYDIAKIYIWKQITTNQEQAILSCVLLMILQRYTFGSKSQLSLVIFEKIVVVYDIAKIGNFSQIATP